MKICGADFILYHCKMCGRPFIKTPFRPNTAAIDGEAIDPSQNEYLYGLSLQIVTAGKGTDALKLKSTLTFFG